MASLDQNLIDEFLIPLDEELIPILGFKHSELTLIQHLKNIIAYANQQDDFNGQYKAFTEVISSVYICRNQTTSFSKVDCELLNKLIVNFAKLKRFIIKFDKPDNFDIDVVRETFERYLVVLREAYKELSHSKIAVIALQYYAILVYDINGYQLLVKNLDDNDKDLGYNEDTFYELWDTIIASVD